MEVKLSVIGAAGKSEETDVSARNQCPAPAASVDKKRPLFPGSTGNGPGARKKFEPPAERAVFPYPGVDRKATRRKNLGKFLGFPLFQSLGNSGRKSLLFPAANPSGKVRPCSSSDEESGARKKFEPPAKRAVFHIPKWIVKRHDGKI